MPPPYPRSCTTRSSAVAGRSTSVKRARTCALNGSRSDAHRGRSCGTLDAALATLCTLCRRMPFFRAMRATGTPPSTSLRVLILALGDFTEVASLPISQCGAKRRFSGVSTQQPHQPMPIARETFSKDGLNRRSTVVPTGSAPNGEPVPTSLVNSRANVSKLWTWPELGS